MGNRIVVGDIHGCAKTFRKLVNKKIRPGKDDELILLGDYINKGPDSKGVLDFIIELQTSGLKVTTLMGNHEKNLLDGLKYTWEEIAFKNHGGIATLKSFNVSKICDIPENYISFIASMPYFLETNKLLIVHAGLNFDLDDPYRDDFAMLNIREMEVRPEKIGNKTIIHGHTPLPWKAIKSKINGQEKEMEYNLDAGCVYPEYPDYGRLAALNIDKWEVYFQKNIEKK